MNSVLCAFVVAEAKFEVFHEGTYLRQVFKTGFVCSCVGVDWSQSTFFSHIMVATGSSTVIIFNSMTKMADIPSVYAPRSMVCRGPRSNPARYLI